MHGGVGYKLLSMQYCFVLLTPSRDSVTKTGVSSDFSVEKVYHEANVMLHTLLNMQIHMKYDLIHLRY